MAAALCSAHGCSDPEVVAALQALNEGCLINSDCSQDPDPLICVFRRCHEQCNTTPDCPVDSRGKQLRCMLGTQPQHVCQLEDEKYCEYNSDCPSGQLCGTDGECRDQCVADRDCVAPQVCVRGTCAEKEELDPETGQLDEAGQPPDQATGYPCDYDSQCVGLADPELACRNGACTVACFDTVDCEGDERCIPDDGDSTTPGACERATDGNQVFCIPGAQVACDCVGGGTGAQVCEPTGSGYGSCTQDGTTPC
jgi:hypothetical protein